MHRAAPVALADVADFGGIAWSPSGEIVIGAGVSEGLLGLFRVNASGGAITPLTKVDSARKELSHQLPRALADGNTILFTLWFGAPKQAQIAATSLHDGKVIPLGVSGIEALGVVDRQLIYLTADGVVMAVPFDAQSLRVSGTPIALQDSIRASRNDASLNDNGGFVFQRGVAKRRLVWVDRKGSVHPVLEDAHEYASVRLSRDERQVAIVTNTAAKSDLWILDLAAATLTPLTTTGETRNVTDWSPDGRRILYTSTHGGSGGFWWQAADGSAPPMKAGVPPHNPWNADLSPDGRNVIFNALSKGTFNLESFSLDAGNASRELAGSQTATEANGRFSPDGRWVAYQSDESGRFEIYVRSYADAGGRTAISTGGGQRPVWSHDGKQLFYWEGNRMTAATLSFDPAPRVVSREPLFTGDYQPIYDVSKDGHFLMIESSTAGLSMVVVPNWRTELRRLTEGAQR